MKETFLKLCDAYARFLYYTAMAAGIAIFVIMWLIDTSALTRKLLNWPVPGSVEITEALMVAGIILPMAYAQATGVHLRVPLVTGLLPVRVRRFLYALAMLIGFAFFSSMAWSSFHFALESWRVDEYVWGANVRFPLYPVKGIMFIGYLMLAAQFLLDTIRVSILGLDEHADQADEATYRNE